MSGTADRAGVWHALVRSGQSLLAAGATILALRARAQGAAPATAPGRPVDFLDGDRCEPVPAAPGQPAAGVRSAGPGGSEPPPSRQLSWERVVLDGVSYRYPGTARPAVCAPSLELARGEALGVLGAPGSGKTTLLELVLGLLIPTTGRVTLDDTPLDRVGWTWLRNVELVSRAVFVSRDTVRRNVAFAIARSAVDDARVRACLSDARLDGFVARLPGGLDARVDGRAVRLSAGDRHRVALARALYRGPGVLALDDAETVLDGLDGDQLRRTLHVLRRGRTLLLAAPRAPLLRYCDRIVILRGGRVHEWSAGRACARNTAGSAPGP